MEPENIPPTVAEEKAQRQAHCDLLAVFLKARQWQEIEPVTLKALIGDNYQQRISDCRKRGLCIQNVPKWITEVDGSKRRLSGNYVYRPQAPLGRDASQPLERPVQQEFFR